mmetsp:Transcript_98660/g.211424  ORF Transcript_98660/g.211424 Transcript_98660/m.211424 type:complete len:243 (+) Transcript_98660:309-1037(+)
MTPSTRRFRSAMPRPVVTRMSPPTNASEIFVAWPPWLPGTGTSPNGNHAAASPSPSCMKRATRSGALSSTRAAWRRNSPPAPPGPRSQATEAAAKRAPSAIGSMRGPPSGCEHAQEPPAAGREPGHATRSPARDTRRRPSPPPTPQDTPNNGGKCEMPASLKVSAAAARGARPKGPRCVVAPKPRGVSAATALPPPCMGGPQANIWGSKNPGHDTGSGFPTSCGSAPRRPSRAAARSSPRGA